MPKESFAESFDREVELVGFLDTHVYGRSRVPPLSALLQRQLHPLPLPPSPVRRDALLVQQPEWFAPLVEARRQLLHNRPDVVQLAEETATNPRCEPRE